MKKTKLFTTLAAFVLVLGLGACDTSSESSDSGTTSEETSGSTDSGTTEGGTTEAVTLSNYTVAFSFVDEEGEATTLPEYATAYIIGDWDSWGAFLPLTEADGVYSYTFSSIDVGTYEYKGVTWYSDETVGWNNCVEIITDGTGNAKLTVSESEGDGYTQKVEVTLTATLEEKPEPVVTYVITIGSLGAAPEGIVLYAAGDFNGTYNAGGWYDWGDPVALTNNGDGTYNFVLYELPESGRSFEILADDTTDESQDMWGYILGNHTFTADEAAGTSVNITITTTYTDWNETATGVFPPKGTEEEEFYVVLYDNSGSSSWSDSYSITFNAQGNYWNNQTSSSCTGTKSALASGQIALYSEAAYALSGTNSWFNVKVDNATMNIAASTLPSNESGAPVYVNYGWFSGWVGTSNTWNANDAGAGTWYYLTSGQTIAEFVSALTIS